MSRKSDMELIMSYLLEMSNDELLKYKDFNKKISYLALQTGIRLDRVRSLCLSNEFIQMYQNELYKRERIGIMHEAMNKQVEIMRKAHYKTSLEATKEIITRCDREFYKNESEKKEGSSNLVDLLSQLKNDTVNEEDNE